MKEVTMEKEKSKSKGTEIEHYSQYKGYPVVKFEGGFQMGKKKVAAVLANIEDLQKFVDGDYDEDIKNLEDGKALKP